MVREWLEKADKDLALATHLLNENAPFPEAIAFHAHQAAEKYLKGLLVYLQIEFSKTHNLGKLLDLISAKNPSLAGSLEEITVLNPYAVEFRYPGPLDITLEDAQKAVQLAAKTGDAVKGTIG